jgi:crotonobetainyl-CoA:carnitine CoA-transferase CaiB-like acyl-CoA transferase
LAALRERDASGFGQYIDMALFDTVAALTMHQAAGYFQTGKVPTRQGNSSGGIMMPYETFKCADGHLIVACGNNSQWQALCKALARDDLAADPRFASPSSRQINRDSALSERTVADLVSRLDAGGVPNGPINDIKQVFEMEQARERGLRIELERGDGTKVPGVRNPIRMSATPVEYQSAAPRLGEHAESVLKDWLGIEAVEVEALRAAGALG